MVRVGVEGLYLDDLDGIVAVGAMVHKALETLRVEHHYLPHPSGRNFLLNDENFVNDSILKLGDYLHGLKR